MATRAKRKRRLTHNQRVLIRLCTMFSILFALGFIIGKITTPVKTVKEPVIEYEYIPVVESNTKNYYFGNIEPQISVDDSAYYELPLSKELQGYISTLCEEENVPVALIYSMISTESEFNPDVVSETDDYGLMQINGCNHEWLEETYGVSDFLDPFENVYCGVKIIGSFLEKYDDYNLALMCYNMGEEGAKNLWEQGIYSSKYSREIVSNMASYEEGSNGSSNKN